MSGTKPTPGPWHQSWDFRRLGNGSDLRVVANACGPQHVCMKGDRIADSDTVVPDKATMEKVYADASLIVRAVNCHADLVAALEAYEREREDMEDRAPTYPECIECNLGTGPHKRTCAHHLARAALAKAGEVE